MTAIRTKPKRSLAVPFSVSIALHVAALALLLTANTGAARARPPVYRLTMVAAPAGRPEIGVVNPAREAPAAKTPPRPTTKTPPPSAKRTPTKAVKATPTPPRRETAADRAAPQPKAGAADPGKGADVANVKTDGLDFPFPGYLENIVRQVRKNFTKQFPEGYTAEYSFIIRRDGTVIGLKQIGTTRASWDFKVEAMGAIEAAGRVKAFGPLPDEFADDALPVVIKFDPGLFRR